MTTDPFTDRLGALLAAEAADPAKRRNLATVERVAEAVAAILEREAGELAAAPAFDGTAPWSLATRGAFEAIAALAVADCETAGELWAARAAMIDALDRALIRVGRTLPTAERARSGRHNPRKPAHA